MIVDDEPYNIEGVRMMLQLLTQQYLPAFDLANIDTAGNGLKAVDRVKSVYAQGQCYKLILMDCNMPKMDGYEATQQIRKHITDEGGIQPTIVALTGHSEEKYIQRALSSGMNSLIKKPCK